MSLNRKNKAIPKVFISLFLSLFIICGATLAHADGKIDVSFYERSSAVMQAFGNALAPSEDGGSMSGTSYLLVRADKKSINAGQAAGLLGYADKSSDQKGVVGWLTSAFSNSSSTFSYDQLSKIPLPDGTTVTKNDNGEVTQQNALTTYAYYGKALDTMGLDKTTADGGGVFNKIFGLFVQGVYMLSSLAPLMFSVALKFLMILNPFMLFDTVLDFGSESDSILGAAAGYVGKLYTTITNFSTGFLIPIFFAVMLFSVFIFRSTKASNKIWRYVLRVFVIVTAVPLIGATYTGTLNNLKENTTTSSKYADYLVYSSFVDFEGWAKQTRLAPPNFDFGVNDTKAIAVKANGDIDGSKIPSKSLVLAINGLSHPDVIFFDGSSDTKDNIWNTIGAEGGKDDDRLKSSVSDMLKRYTNGDLYTSADYEGYVKSSINEKMMTSNGKSDESATKSIYKMITISPEEFGKKDELGIFGDDPDFDNNTPDKPDDDFMGKYRYSIYNAGELTRDPTTNAYKTATNPELSGYKVEPIGQGSSGAGLTPLGMYNYLNTDFNTMSMTVYSSEKSSSAFVKRSHYSVVFAGDGIGLFVGMISLIAVMMCLTVVSLVYSFGMIRIAFASIPRITAGVFGTTFGSLGSFAKLLVSTIILIIEIVGSMFLYSVTESIMVSIMASLDTLESLMGLGGNGNFLSATTTILTNMFTIILAVIIMIVSIKNRNKFVKIFEEVANEAIKKLMGGLDNVTNNGNAFHDGGAGMQKAINDGASNYGRNAAISADADKTQNGRGQNSEKKGGIVQLAKDAIGENNRLSHKMARSGEFDAQTPSQAMANSSEILGRKMGAALKDKALGFIGLEGHNLERDNEYAKQKEHALDEYLRPEMQRDALDDVQGYKQSDDDAYNEELRAAGLDPESSDTDPFMRGTDADNTGMADSDSGRGARVDENGNPVDENGKSKASDVEAGKTQDDKGGIKSELLKKPNMKDVERAKNGASAGGYMGAGAAVVGGRVKDAVSKKAVDKMKEKLSSNDDSASSVMADKDHKDDKSGIKSELLKKPNIKDVERAKNGASAGGYMGAGAAVAGGRIKDAVSKKAVDTMKGKASSNNGSKSNNKTGLKSKVKDYASATKEVGPGFKRGFGQAMNHKYNVSGSSDYKQSLHRALAGSDAMSARNKSMAVLKKNGISSYGDYKSKLFDIDKGIESAKKNESKYASDVAKLGATPDGRSSEQYQRASTNLATAQTQRASLLNQRKTLHSHASGLLQQKGLAINGVTSRPFTGNPNAALSMIGELRSLQNQSGNFRGKSDSKSRKELGNITNKMSDIRNELSNSGFVVSKLNSLREIDTFKHQFEDGYTDFFKGKHY